MAAKVEHVKIEKMLAELLDRDVRIQKTDAFTPHDVTLRGLVSNENDLVGVIGADLDFAHRSGAALAMMPGAPHKEPAADPDPTLIEVYGEVANVLSRLANEASPARLRLDPGMSHANDALHATIENGTTMFAIAAEIDGYGTGLVGTWLLPE